MDLTVTAFVLTLNIILCLGSDICEGEDCKNSLDVPLIDKLNAPLKAEVDISKLNEQLKRLISQEVKRHVENAVKTLVDNRLMLAEEDLRMENNRTFSLMFEDWKEQNRPIAFFAYLSGDWKDFTTHKTLIYDVVDLNIGNTYNKITGMFTAPSSGIYVFHVSTGAIDKTHASVQLVLNGKIKNIGWADSYNHNDRTFATTVTPLQLEKGDVVGTRIGNAYGRFIESNSLIRTSFSGVKIN